MFLLCVFFMVGVDVSVVCGLGWGTLPGGFEVGCAVPYANYSITSCRICFMLLRSKIYHEFTLYEEKTRNFHD